MTLRADPLLLGTLAALSGWAAADTTAAFQLMVGQPIVAGWLAGCLVHQPGLGLFMGAALQLLWTRLTPVGAAAYPDVGPGTVAGVAVAGLFFEIPPVRPLSAAAAFPVGGAALACLTGLLVALAVGRVGQSLTVALRRDNARLAHAADRAAARGSFAGVEWANALGVARSFSRGALLLAAGLAGFALLAWLAGLMTGSAAHPPAFGAGAGAASAAAGQTAGPAAGVSPVKNPGPVLFWWFGIAALLSVLWRGGRRDWLALVAGAAAGGLLVALR